MSKYTNAESLKLTGVTYLSIEQIKSLVSGYKELKSLYIQATSTSNSEALIELFEALRTHVTLTNFVILRTRNSSIYKDPEFTSSVKRLAESRPWKRFGVGVVELGKENIISIIQKLPKEAELMLSARDYDICKVH